MTDQHIYIFDGDGTIIDSSHRGLSNADGSINLEHWKENSTPQQIAKDKLLPLYYYCVFLKEQGHKLIFCTARELGKGDHQFFIRHNFHKIFDRIISRPIGDATADHELKAKQLQYLFNLKWAKDRPKFFYDDNAFNRKALSDLGAISINPADYLVSRT